MRYAKKCKGVIARVDGIKHKTTTLSLRIVNSPHLRWCDKVVFKLLSCGSSDPSNASLRFMIEIEGRVGFNDL